MRDTPSALPSWLSWIRASGASCPSTISVVLGDKAEDAFRQSMIMSQGSLAIFWSNPLVATLAGLGLLLLCWPLIGAGLRRLVPSRRPADALEEQGER